MSDFTINQRKNWVAEFTLCESDSPPPIAASALVQQLARPTDPLNPNSPGSNTGYNYSRNGYVYYRYPTGPWTPALGEWNADTFYVSTSDPTYRVVSGRARSFFGGSDVPSPNGFSTGIQFVGEFGVPATVSGNVVRVVFPMGTGQNVLYYSDESRSYGFTYKVIVGGAVLTTGAIEMILGELQDDDGGGGGGDPDSSFEVCSFNASVAA